MRYLILSICSLFLLSCSSEGDKIEPSCAQNPNSKECRALHQKQLNQCFTQVCGSKEDFHSTTDFENIAAKREHYLPKTSIYKNLNKTVREKIRLEMRFIKKLEQALERLSKKEKLKLSDTQKSARNRHDFMQFYSLFVAEKLKSKAKNLSFAEFISGRPKVSEKDKKWLQSVANSPHFNPPKDLFLSRRYGVAYFKETYPSKDLKEAIRASALKCIMRHRQIERKLGIPAIYYKSISREICEYAYNKPHSPINLDLLSQHISHLEHTHFFFKDDLDSLWLSRDFDVKELLKFVIKNKAFYIPKEQQDIKFIKRSLNPTLNFCHSVVGKAYETAPTPEEREKAENLIDKIKEITRNKFTFPDPSMTSFFNKELDAISFYTPLSREDYEQNIIGSFEIVMKNLRKKDSVLSSHNSILTALLILSPPQVETKASEELQNQQHLAKNLREVESFCLRFGQKTFGDHIYKPTGEIHLSWNTIKHLDTGFGTIAHEIGHGVSNIFQKMRERWSGPYYLQVPFNNPLWENRACVDQFHSKSNKRTNEAQYTEEDWADAFASEIMKSYQGEELKPKNYACSLTIEIFGETAIGLPNAKASLWSSPTFRAIHIHKNLNGALPDSCQESLKVKSMPACF